MISYVARNEHGTLWVAGTRVTVASVVHAFWNGDSAEEIVQSYPSLSLESVHGALAYYLAHRAEIDDELARVEERWVRERTAAQQHNSALRARLLEARAARAAS